MVTIPQSLVIMYLCAYGLTLIKLRCAICSEMLKQSVAELTATTNDLEKKLDGTEEDSK